jgi:RHS repeat-associated protein
MSYNRRLQASQAKLSLGSSVLQQYDYGYGEFNTSTGAVDTSKNNGQIAKITSTIGTSTQWLQGFQYDELGRLKNVAEYQSGSMSSQTYSQGYTFDRYGNRFQSANSTLGLPAVSSSEINAATNRFINSGSTPTTYDAAGNITTDTKFRGMNYSYDANGRMTFAETANHGTQQTSTYDAAGQRVKTSVTVNKTATTRTMVYDIFGQDVADYSGSSGTTLERENIYRGEQLLATYEAGSSALKYVLTDIQGSTRAIMNNSGSSSSVIARHDYLPFGEEISSGIGLRTSTQGYGATDTNRQKYALTERDDATGLDHTWWRKYEDLSGRWTSPDPYNGSMRIGKPQSFNRFAYVRSDPVNLVDPSGLDGDPDICPECIIRTFTWAPYDRLMGTDFGRDPGLRMRRIIDSQEPDRTVAGNPLIQIPRRVPLTWRQQQLINCLHNAHDWLEKQTQADVDKYVDNFISPEALAVHSIIAVTGGLVPDLIITGAASGAVGVGRQLGRWDAYNRLKSNCHSQWGP